MPSPSHSSWFYHPHDIGWGVQNIYLLVMQSPPVFHLHKPQNHTTVQILQFMFLKPAVSHPPRTEARNGQSQMLALRNKVPHPPKKIKHINPCSDYGLFRSLAWGKPQSISFQTVTHSPRLKLDYSQLHISSPKHSLRMTLPAARFMYRTPSSLWILPSRRRRLFFCWSWVSNDSAVV